MNNDNQPFSKVISAADAGTIKRWDMPTVGKPSMKQVQESSRVLTDKELDAIRQAAYSEAYQQGYEAGSAKGLQEARNKAEKMQALMDMLARPFAEQDAVIEEQVARLAMVVAQQLVRREFTTHPQHIVGVVRDALQMLPVNCEEIRLFLHPEDAKLVTDILGTTDAERQWKIVEDPMLTRGGCRVAAGDSRIDESFEMRMGRVVSKTLGGLRSGDDGDAAD